MRFNGKIFFWLSLILIVIVRLRLADLPMERDEGEYAYAGWQILRGKLPYADFYNMKFPGVYYMYAGVFSLAGHSMVAVRVWVLLMNLLSAFFIYKIAEKRLFSTTDKPNNEAKWLAGGIYLLLSISFGAQGAISNCEHFVVFFATMGLWLLSERLLFLAGLALGISVLMKQQGLVVGAFAGLTILYELYQDKSRDKILIIKRLFSFGFGIALPIVGLFAFVLKNNIFDEFYFYTFEYARAYSAIMKPTLKEIHTFTNVFIDNPILWLIFFIGIFKIGKDIFTKKSLYTEGGGFLLLWALSFVSVSAGWYFRPHYWQLMFPAVALVVAYTLTKQSWQIFNYALTKNRVLSFIFISSLLAQPCYFFFYPHEHIIRKMYAYDYFTDIRRFSEFLQQHIPENERIGQYSCEPQVWFYSNREGASGFMYGYPLTENQPYADTMTNTFIRETETTNPEWLLYSNISKGEDNKKTIQLIDDWFDNYAKNYQVKGVLYHKSKGFAEWEWQISAVDTSRKPLMIVYQRKKSDIAPEKNISIR
jgi:Dolichyl-phosphate-mannose-protein mannosyltransferase